MNRLGVNGARLFVNPVTNLRSFIGASFGKNLNGLNVSSRSDFYAAIASLRTLNGRNSTYPWKNPVKWQTLFNLIASVTQPLYGSDEYTILRLNNLNIKTLVVQPISCSNFQFFSMDNSNPVYWSERWELYKHSYALAIWARSRCVSMIEFYNEPDIDLGSCLDANRYKELYQIRSLSIQNAYSDYNSMSVNKINVQIAASAFARITYGGNATRYLGDLSVQNNNFIFDNNSNQLNWSNMNLYSYHSYGKTGAGMLDDANYLFNAIRNNTMTKLPIIVTEFNAHTSSDWNTICSTGDDAFEASRLASQILNLAMASVSYMYVFKFSITPSSSSSSIAKNGLHWGELNAEPFNIADTTLSAEAMRLLTQMKQSKLYKITSNDNLRTRTYLSSKNDNESYYYLYAVNDRSDSVNLNLNLTQWNVNQGTVIFVETASDAYWGEVSNLVSNPGMDNSISIQLNPFSTNRLTVQTGVQRSSIWNAIAACTLYAGARSDQANCAGQFVYAGTSNTTQHENTSIAYLRFRVGTVKTLNQKFFLSMNVENVFSNDLTLTVLGINNVSSAWNANTTCWNAFSNSILTALNSGTRIDAIYKNFINWTSSSNISLVGHVTGKRNSKAQLRMIDVTDYVGSMIGAGKTELTFVLYRPFRHPEYSTACGPVLSDDLSAGASLKIAGINTAAPPQLIQMGP